jgi:O-antigen ligase
MGISKRFASASPLLWAALLGLALFLGLVSSVLPGWLIFAALLVPAIAVVLLLRPEYGLLVCMALVCGLIHPAFVPRVPVLGGALAAADATLAMLALYALWALASQRRPSAAEPLSGARWMALTISLFGLCLVVALTDALALKDIKPSFVLGEARDLLYLLMLPMALIILRPQERQRRFVLGVVVLGCLFAVGQVLQGVFNLPVFGAQGISVLETLGRQEDSTTRATTLGLNIIIFALLLTIAAYTVGAIRKLMFFSVGGLLLVGIVLTFGRTTFAAVLICALLVVWWLNPKKLPQLLTFLMVVVGLGSAVAAYWKPDSFAAVAYRLTSISEEIDHGYSAQWRIWEAEAMLPKIKEHPLLGVGLGADYKGSRGSKLRPDLNRYVHNAYLYMGGKMGLPALLFFLLFMAAVFAMGRGSARSHGLTWSRIVGAASAAMMIRFLLASITEPHLMSDYGVVIIAVAAALVVLSARRAHAPPPAAGVAMTPTRASQSRWATPTRARSTAQTP